jgi:hypothetical protein
MFTTIHILSSEGLCDSKQDEIVRTIRTNIDIGTKTDVRICNYEHEAADGHLFIAFLLREFQDRSVVSFHFLQQGADHDTLRSFATMFIGSVSAQTAPKAGIIKKVSHLVVSQAVESAQALVPRPSIGERCRHVSRQIITHLLKLGIVRTSPPYDLVAAIALDMFLRGQKANSIVHLQDAVMTSNIPTAIPLCYRNFRRLIVHTDISFHHRAKEADIDDQHAVVFVLAKSLGKDADPYPNDTIDIVLSARHKDADLCKNDDGVVVHLTSPSSVLVLAKEQVALFNWEIVKETASTLEVWSTTQRRALTINVHSEFLDDNHELEETLKAAYQLEKEPFVTLMIGPVTPALARLYASHSYVISGTSVDEGVNSGVTSKDARLMGGKALPELCDDFPMYEFDSAAESDVDSLGSSSSQKCQALEDILQMHRGEGRPILLNLKPNVSRFLFTPDTIIQHPDVIMAQYEYALKTVQRPFWKSKLSGTEVRLAYSNGLTTPSEGPVAVVTRLRRYIAQGSDISEVVEEYLTQHPTDTGYRIILCAMQHAATVVCNVLTEFGENSVAQELREQLVEVVRNVSITGFQSLYTRLQTCDSGWNSSIEKMMRVQMPDATPTSIACLLRCMLALFLHRFVQAEYARVGSGLPSGDVITFSDATPTVTVDPTSSETYYSLDAPFTIGDCFSIIV